nr:HD domain-containing protein [Deltaproteobacteria bacterium]
MRLFQYGHRWGRAWGRFFRLREEDHGRFLLNLQVACLFHDLGKANAEFFALVSGKSVMQTLRHEHISALVLHPPAVREWLKGNPALDLEVITAAVLSHHLKAAPDGDWKWGQPRAALFLVLYLQHPEVGRILERIATTAGLPSAPALTPQPWSPKEPWQQAWAAGNRAALDVRAFLRRAHHEESAIERRRLLLAVKAGLICADSAASALEREAGSFDWINETANDAAVTAEEIASKIIEPRMAQVAKDKGKPFELHAFQHLAGKQGPRALLRAACGMGKTMAAWKWAETQARTREIGRVIFLYPTRGTATEGFRDYVAWAPESDASLITGTARYELDRIHGEPGGEGAGGVWEELSVAPRRRSDSLRWGTGSGASSARRSTSFSRSWSTSTTASACSRCSPTARSSSTRSTASTATPSTTWWPSWRPSTSRFSA